MNKRPTPSNRRYIEPLIVIEIVLLIIVAAVAAVFWADIRLTLGQLVGTVFAGLTALNAALIAWFAATAKIAFDKDQLDASQETKRANRILRLYYELSRIEEILIFSGPVTEGEEDQERLSAFTKALARDLLEIPDTVLSDAMENIGELPIPARKILVATNLRLIDMKSTSKIIVGRHTDGHQDMKFEAQYMSNNFKVLQHNLQEAIDIVRGLAAEHGLVEQDKK